MENIEVSRITFAIDASLAPLVDEVLTDLALPEVFIQRGKQVSLAERSGWFGLRATTTMEENRVWIYRFYTPRSLEKAYMRRIAEATDLHLPGRGFIYAQDASLISRNVLNLDEKLLGELAVQNSRTADIHIMLCCIVQRGMAEALTRTVLEMGRCVPVVSFGEGMGLRNKLGLLRVTIPVDKELIYFIVPVHDADLLEGVAVHKAHLDRPGQGFIYRSVVRAAAVNLQVRRGVRRYAASMEQVVAALDDIRGSAEWRRSASARKRAPNRGTYSGGLVCLSLFAEEGALVKYVRAAMDAGAGGATLVSQERHCYRTDKEEAKSEKRTVSHAWETCELIIPGSIQERVLKAVEEQGLFDDTGNGIAELTSAERAITYTGQ